MAQIEELQKAAGDYAKEKNRKHDPATLSDLEAKEASRTDFCAGANWQRNHAWHEAIEKPKHGYDKEIVVQMKSGYHRITVGYDARLWVNITMWAYLEDILPL